MSKFVHDINSSIKLHTYCRPCGETELHCYFKYDYGLSERLMEGFLEDCASLQTFTQGVINTGFMNQS